MPNPWDVPPLPTRGDDEAEWTFAGIGRVTSQWEVIEFEFSRLYSIFVGKPDEEMRGYGQGRIFRDRSEILTKAAEEYFTGQPNQELEGQLHSLMSRAQGFSDRRNEVAHGIVFQLQRLTFFRQSVDADVRGKFQYGLVPPYHTLRKHGPDGLPLYAYASTHLLEFEEAMAWLEIDLANYRRQIVPDS